MKDSIDLAGVYLLNDTILVEPKKTFQQVQDTAPTDRVIPGSFPVGEGYVLRIGPGYPMELTDKMAMGNIEVTHLPLQVEVGNRVVYRMVDITELSIKGNPYHILRQHQVLLGFDNDY